MQHQDAVDLIKTGIDMLPFAGECLLTIKCENIGEFALTATRTDCYETGIDVRFRKTGSEHPAEGRMRFAANLGAEVMTWDLVDGEIACDPADGTLFRQSVRQAARNIVDAIDTHAPMTWCAQVRDAALRELRGLRYDQAGMMSTHRNFSLLIAHRRQAMLPIEDETAAMKRAAERLGAFNAENAYRMELMIQVSGITDRWMRQQLFVGNVRKLYTLAVETTDVLTGRRAGKIAQAMESMRHPWVSPFKDRSSLPITGDGIH